MRSLVLALLLCSSCAFELNVTKTKGNTSATGAGAVATTATKTEAPVASAPAATATEVEKPKSTVAVGPGTVATDYRKAGQDGGAVATAPGATASATTSTSVRPLVVAGIVIALLSCIVWFLLYCLRWLPNGGPIGWLVSKLV